MAEDFVLDSNVFIQAYNDYYSMDLVPAFWDFLTEANQSGKIYSIDRVYLELEAKDDALFEWAKNNLSIFVPSTGADVAAVYSDMVNWVQNSQHFTDPAKHKFARVADGWLTSYAKIHGDVVVTMETYNAKTRADVKIPNLCEQYDIPWTNTFGMLRRLGARFDRIQ